MDTIEEARTPLRPLDPEKRHAILCAAHEAFLRDGYARTSMDEVARMAGVGKMTVYRHFGNKETLFEQMLRSVCDGMFEKVPPAAEGGLADALSRIAWAFLDLISPPDRLAVFRLVLAEAERFPEMASRFHDAAIRTVLDYTADRIRAHAPWASADEARFVAANFMNFVKGPAYMRLMLGVPPEPWNAEFAPQVEAGVEWACDRLERGRPG